MKSMLLLSTYHPFLKSLTAIIDKNLNLLYMNKDVNRVFTRDLWFHFVVLVN